MQEILSSTFEKCESLVSIHWPRQLESIGYKAFFGCSSLKKLVIPEGVEVLDQGIFEDCSSLESLKLPRTLRRRNNIMKKVSVPATNDLCPQTLFVYGTMNSDGTPNFGLFCWFSYCWYDQLGIICAIGGSKRTLENIRRSGVFSANLVVEDNLPLADYFGTADGRDSDKMEIPVDWEAGAVLQVPVLCSSPLSFELAVDREIPTGEHDETILLCHIRNTLKAETLIDPSLPPEERFKKTAAVRTCIDEDYWSWDGRHLGKWHERAKEIKADVEIGAAARGN